MRKQLLILTALALATAVATVLVSLARTGTFMMDRVETPGGREIPSMYFPVAAVALLVAAAAGVSAFVARGKVR
jgi:hypothetical protein